MATKKPAAKPVKPVKKQAAVKVAEMVVNQTEMAAILKVSTRFFREMVTDGIVHKQDGGYQVSDTVRAYADHLKIGAVKKTGNASMDALREEKTLDIRLKRARDDRQLVSMDEALGFFGEVTGFFVSYLSGLPAEITGVPRERQRLNDIIDLGRQRLADSFAKARQAFESGREDPDTEAED